MKGNLLHGWQSQVPFDERYTASSCLVSPSRVPPWFPYFPCMCHILEFWLSPTLMISRHLWCHLQSCVATSLYAREVIMLYFTNIDKLYILQFLYSGCYNSEYNKLLVLCRYSLRILFVYYFLIYLFVYSDT